MKAFIFLKKSIYQALANGPLQINKLVQLSGQNELNKSMNYINYDQLLQFRGYVHGSLWQHHRLTS